MTITTYCLEQLLADGPLALDELTRRAVEERVTTSKVPSSSVRSALANAAILLPDQRWDSPRRLLEGRMLTTRSFGHDQYDDDGFTLPNHSAADLGLLTRALRHGAIPLASGGLLRCGDHGAAWLLPPNWKPVDPGRFQLLSLRVVEGVLHIQPVDNSLDLQQRQLGLDSAPSTTRRHWGDPVRQVQAALEEQLWLRLAADPTFLTAPAAPFSECVPALRDALEAAKEQRERREARQREFSQFGLELPRSVSRIAHREAERRGIDVQAYLEQLMTATLVDLADQQIPVPTAPTDDGLLYFPRRL